MTGMEERVVTIDRQRPRPAAWIRDSSTVQRQALLAGSLGWMLDSMDVMLYALVITRAKADLHMSSSTAGLIMSATLVSAALGGMLFGWVADRVGRARALTYSILIYCIGTGLCGLVHTPMELALCRIFLGFGMGGEWAAGAALVAETWPDQHRGKALALMQSSWAVGYALAAALVAIIMPHFGWRAIFFAGLLPALATVWIRRHVDEPERWKTSDASHVSIIRIFRGALAKRLAIVTTMNAATLFAWWGLFFWVPAFLSLPVSQGGRGLNVLQTSSWTIVMQIGTFLGYVSFGFLADHFGRKRVYITFLFVAAVVVQIYARATSAEALLWLGPLVGFWGTGYFSGFAVITSELFPTSIRGSAMGFAYNTGRIVSAAAPYVIGKTSEHNGIGPALLITSGAFLLAAIIAFGVPETLGTGLKDRE